MSGLFGHMVGVVILLLMAVFIGIWVWAWRPRHRAVFDALSEIPMREGCSEAAGDGRTDSELNARSARGADALGGDFR